MKKITLGLKQWIMDNEKQFEDYFSAIQTEWVELGLEYVPDADKIFIHCSYESNMYSFNVFYLIDGIVVRKHKINTISGRSYDISAVRQRALLNFGVEELRKMRNLFKEFNREMPTEIKLIYDVKENSLEGDYSYELKHSNTKDLTADDIFDKWFDDVKKEYNQ